MLMGVAKFVPLPAVVAWELLGATSIPGAGTIAALLAIAVLMAGVFMFGTLKNRAEQAERVKDLAIDEADIERKRADRERDERVAAEAEVERLKARPDLEEHARLLAGAVQLQDKMLDFLKRHEESTKTGFRDVDGHLSEIEKRQEDIARAVGADNHR